MDSDKNSLKRNREIHICTCIFPYVKFTLPNAKFTLPNAKFTLPNTKYTLPNTKCTLPEGRTNVLWGRIVVPVALHTCKLLKSTIEN